MGTSADTMEFLLDQLSEVPNLHTRKMFGEYCLYLAGKPIAFVCDDELFIKPNDAAAAFIGQPVMGHAYPGSKLYIRITPDQWEDREWLAQVVHLTYEALPEPAPRKPRAKKKSSATDAKGRTQ